MKKMTISIGFEHMYLDPMLDNKMKKIVRVSVEIDGLELFNMNTTLRDMEPEEVHVASILDTIKTFL